MNGTHQPTLKKPGEGQTVAVVGDTYRILAAGEDTGGRYALMHATVPPGSGPPPHIHSREEEGFYILEGEITIQIGEQRVIAGPGTFANVPIGLSHFFKNESSRPAKMLIWLSPAGLEKMFLEVGNPVAVGETPAGPPTKEEIRKLLAAAPRYGVEIRMPAS